MEDFYGWRAQIGLIYPGEGLVMEPEFEAMSPVGVTTHTSRVALLDATLDGLGAMMADDRIEKAAALFGRAPLDVITFGGTSATFMYGLDYDREVIKRMEEVLPGVPGSTTSTAAVRALQAVGAQKMVFVGPYLSDVTERGRQFFSASGFEVLGAHGLEMSDNLELNDLSLERVYQFAKQCFDPAADALFISCTGIRTVGAIEALEYDLGCPVVTSIQATFWDALRIAGVGGGDTSFGCLFDY